MACGRMPLSSARPATTLSTVVRASHMVHSRWPPRAMAAPRFPPQPLLRSRATRGFGPAGLCGHEPVRAKLNGPRDVWFGWQLEWSRKAVSVSGLVHKWQGRKRLRHGGPELDVFGLYFACWIVLGRPDLLWCCCGAPPRQPKGLLRNAF